MTHSKGKKKSTETVFEKYLLAEILDKGFKTTVLKMLKELKERDFPGGAVVKNPPATAGNTGSSPGPGRSHMPWSN